MPSHNVLGETLLKGSIRRQNQVQRQIVLRRKELPEQAAARRKNELLHHRVRGPRFSNLARINVVDVLPDERCSL